MGPSTTREPHHAPAWSTERLPRPTGEHDATAYERQPLTDEELALATAEDWGPAEDWSDLAAWLDERDAKG